jgi:hypothetical protein
MAVQSKNKGNTFERKISNLLSKRFAEITGIETAFRRNIDSGSFFGGKNQQRTVTHNLETATFGDIVCPSNFKFSLECKHYKSAPSFALLINQNWKELDSWIEQASQDAANGDKALAVIVKYNNVPEIVVLDKLPAGLTAIVNYKQYFVLPLAAWLALPDTEFFD